MEAKQNTRGKGKPVAQTTGSVSSDSGNTDTSTTDASVSSEPTRERVNWGGSIRQLLEYANVEEGTPVLTQVIGNFEDAPDFFWNSVGQGIKVIVNEDTSDITLVYSDGSQKQITL